MAFRNPQPEFEILLQDIPQEDYREAVWLLNTLLEGRIPGRVPATTSSALRMIATSFRMWAFIHRPMVRKLALAMAYEFGPYATYLEIMAGAGWLSKGLYEAGLTGVYIATDLRPPEEPAHPVFRMGAVEAILKHRGSVDAYILSWPLRDEQLMHEVIESIPTGSKIVYIGEPRDHHCGSLEFFQRTEPTETRVLQWEEARLNHFSWKRTCDSIYLLTKTH